MVNLMMFGMKRQVILSCALLGTLTVPASAAPWVANRCLYDNPDPLRARIRVAWANRWYAENPYGLASGHDSNYIAGSLRMAVKDFYDTYGIILYPVYVDAIKFQPFLGPGAPGTATVHVEWYQIAELPYTLKPQDVFNDGICEPEPSLLGSMRVLCPAGERTVASVSPGPIALRVPAKSSVFGRIPLIASTVHRYSVDPNAQGQVLRTLLMESGDRLTVTLLHPLVTSTGELKRAAELTIDDSLVRSDGSTDQIVGIEEQLRTEALYRLTPPGDAAASGLFVIDGYLTGSNTSQSEPTAELNRILIRQNIPDSLLIGAQPG